MPSRKKRDGTFKDVVHPLHSEMRKKLEEAVIKKYQEALDSGVDYATVEEKTIV